MLKQGELSGSVRAAVKAALAFRSLATRDDARAAGDYDAEMTGTGSSGGCGHNDDSENFIFAHSLFPVQLFKNVTDGRIVAPWREPAVLSARDCQPWRDS